MPRSLAEAMTALNAGALADAEAACAEALAADGANAKWRHLLGLVRARQGRLDEARKALEESVRLEPAAAAFHYNLGGVLDRAGDLAAALAAFERALALAPDEVELHVATASVLRRTGRLDGAAARLAEAAERFPDNPHVWRNYGAVLHAMANHDGARAACERAAALAPDLAEARRDLGAVLFDMGLFEDAAEACRAALDRDSSLAEAEAVLGRALAALGRHREALPHLLRSRGAGAGGIGHLLDLDEALRRRVPDWHVTMLRDEARNEAYRRAIEERVRPGMSVLEIGTGSGLLAMMAARAGAGRVDTCEMEPAVAEAARAIVAANGYGDRIFVHAKHSQDLIVDEDLPARAELMVSEILSSNLFGEGVVESLRHARTELLAEDAPVIPERMSVITALVAGDNIDHLFRLPQSVEGFDLAAMEALVPLRLVVDRPLTLLSPGAPALTFDLRGPVEASGARRFSLEASAAGEAVGLAQWIRLGLSETVDYENAPGDGASHWFPVVYRFPAPVAVRPGDVVHVEAVYAGHRMFMNQAPTAAS